MKKVDVLKVLNRPEHTNLTSLDVSNLKNGERILITGANGSIGTALLDKLNEYKDDESLREKNNVVVLSTDIEGEHEYLDITDFKNVFSMINKFKPTIIINIAGAKHAPLGEHA